MEFNAKKTASIILMVLGTVKCIFSFFIFFQYAGVFDAHIDAVRITIIKTSSPVLGRHLQYYKPVTKEYLDHAQCLEDLQEYYKQLSVKFFVCGITATILGMVTFFVPDKTKMVTYVTGILITAIYIGLIIFNLVALNVNDETWMTIHDYWICPTHSIHVDLAIYFNGAIYVLYWSVWFFGVVNIIIYLVHIFYNRRRGDCSDRCSILTKEDNISSIEIVR